MVGFRKSGHNLVYTLMEFGSIILQCTHTHRHMHTQMHMHICKHVCVYSYMCVYACMHVCVDVHYNLFFQTPLMHTPISTGHMDDLFVQQFLVMQSVQPCRHLWLCRYKKLSQKWRISQKYMIKFPVIPTHPCMYEVRGAYN